MSTNIGSARIRFVTTRSILSDTVSFCPFAAFFTHLSMIDEIYEYLSLVMILSVSSSKSSSSFLISDEQSGAFFICSMILLSFSMSLIAKNLFLFSSISSFALTLSIAASTVSSKLWTLAFAVFDFAAAIAFSLTSSIPVPLRAEISTTSHPRASFRFLILMESPFFFTRSIMLTAMTTGIPSSISCVER